MGRSDAEQFVQLFGLAQNEALLEISTDKVDAEVPSPTAGTILEIRVNEGETVEVGSVLARIGSSMGAAASTPAQQQGVQPTVAAPIPQAQPQSVEQPETRTRAAVAGDNGGGNGQFYSPGGVVAASDGAISGRGVRWAISPLRMKKAVPPVIWMFSLVTRML